MRLREPLKVSWDKVDLKAGLIRLKAEDVKENWPRRTPNVGSPPSPGRVAPRASQGSEPSGSFVFTKKNGKPIENVREAWLKRSKQRSRISSSQMIDVVPHDFRRSAITRWTTLGIPRDIVMACSGPKPNGYINFSDEQLVNGFR